MSTSLNEGFCIPYIECQSMGLPCLVPDLDVFKEFNLNSLNHIQNLSIEHYLYSLRNMLDQEQLSSPSPQLFDPSPFHIFSPNSVLKQINNIFSDINPVL